MPQTEPTYDYQFLKKPLTAGVIGCPFSCVLPVRRLAFSGSPGQEIPN